MQRSLSSAINNHKPCIVFVVTAFIAFVNCIINDIILLAQAITPSIAKVAGGLNPKNGDGRFPSSLRWEAIGLARLQASLRRHEVFLFRI